VDGGTTASAWTRTRLSATTSDTDYVESVEVRMLREAPTLNGEPVLASIKLQMAAEERIRVHAIRAPAQIGRSGWRAVLPWAGALDEFG
jgi:hypothetical protein